MAVRRISTILAVDGEAAYKSSISNINTSLKTLQTELAVVESAYKGNEDSLEALSAKKEALTNIQAKEIEKIQSLESALTNAQTAQQKHAAEYESYSQKVAEAEQALKELSQQTGDVTEEQEKLTKELEEYRTAQQNAEASQAAATKGVEQWQQKLNLAQKDLNNTTAEIKETDEALADLDTTLEDVTEGLEMASSNLTSAGNALTVGLTVPLIAAGTAAVSYASDTEESLNKVDVAFADSASKVTEWSSTTLTAYGLAQGTALDMAALYGDMATAMGYTNEAAAEMSMDLVGLAADLSSFKNVTIDVANTALKGIFTGETESLKNLGVVMTEVNLEAYAMEQGFQKSYTEMEQAEKVALRYEYVLSATENAQGDFARTSDSTANQIRILQESLKETAATMGEDLLPIVTPIIENLGELTQTFTELSEEEREAIIEAGIFLATLGPALTITGNLTGAIGAGVTAYQSLKAAQTASATAQVGVNVAMAANPIGAVVTAVGGLVAVLAALAVSQALTAEKAETMTDALDESKEAYLGTIESIKTQDGEVQDMITTLMTLEAQEGKTSAQKEVMLQLVEELNEAVPDLALAYDAEADSLNLTAEGIRAVAQAEAERQTQTADIERLTELYKEQTDIELEMADAKAEQTQAYEAYNQKLSESAGVSDNYQQELSDLIQRTYDADDAVGALTSCQERNAAEVAELESKYDDQTETTEELTEATDDLCASQQDATLSVEELTAETDRLTEASSALSGAMDTLSSAMEEQTESGSLSLDTTLDLIDAGYATALSINTETGAITLSKDTYVALTKAKLATQQASLDQQITSLQSTIQMQQEAEMAARLALSYTDVAIAQTAISDAKDQLASLEAQKAALTALVISLDSYTGAVITTSEQVTTQAERDLQTFQDLSDALEHQRTMEEISQAEYYETLAKYRDDYLTDDANLEEYRSITEEIYEYDQELAESEQALWEEQTQQLEDTLESRMEAILDKQTEMQTKLADYGDLFEIEDDQASINNLQDQIDAMEQYQSVLEQLRDSGIDDGLLSEITSMDVDDALAYGQELLNLTAEQLAEYNDLWVEKQAKALEISAAFYAEEARLAEEEFKAEFLATLDETQVEAYQSGMDTVQSLIDGINAKMPSLSAAISQLNSMLSLQADLSIQVDGSHADGLSYVPYDGYIAELHQGEQVLTAQERAAYVAQSTPQSLELVETNQGQDTAAAIVNGIVGAVSQMGGGTSSSQPIHIHVDVGEKEIAKAVYEPLKDIKRQRGE